MLNWLESAGAVISTVFSEALLMIVTLIICRKDGVFSLKKIAHYSKNYLISSLIMGGILITLNFVIGKSLIFLIIKMLIAVIVYFIVLLILKDFAVLSLLKIILGGVNKWKIKS